MGDTCHVLPDPTLRPLQHRLLCVTQLSLAFLDLVSRKHAGLTATVGGGDLAVTSFIDNDIPESGEIGYEVVAFDFHDNRSSPTAITVELP